MEHVFSDRLMIGGAGNYLNPTGFQCDLGDMSIMAMPPGNVDVNYDISRAAVNVMPFSNSKHHLAKLNGERFADSFGKHKSSTFFGAGRELELHCVNQGWELLLEAGDQYLQKVDAEACNGAGLTDIDTVSQIDNAASALSQMAIAELKQPTADKVYLEGLGIALLARTLRSSGLKYLSPSTAGTDRRIDRAIDYIRADLTKPMTIADLATIACMSPSWFSRAFRAQTGMSVHAYIQERRLEHASLLLQTGRDSLASNRLGLRFRRPFAYDPPVS